MIIIKTIIMIMMIINLAMFSFSSADDLKGKRYTEGKCRFNMKINNKIQYSIHIERYRSNINHV